LKTSDFYYELPEELIASRPTAERSGSRMMVIDRAGGEISHRMFVDLPHYLSADDLLVLNDTRVVPARVFLDDGAGELLWLETVGEHRWRCLVKPGRRMRAGRTFSVGGIRGVVVEVLENGDRIVAFDAPIDLQEQGHLALPHYMKREDERLDRERYQTVYARAEGAIAVPTAGLHFTREILRGLPHTHLTLHVGVGTFRPVRSEQIEEHSMHSEKYSIDPEAAGRIGAAGRVVAVGTTVVRVLEHVHRRHGRIVADSGETDIFLYPGRPIEAVGALLTNFHLPESTLLMLVSAMAGRECILEAYRQAVEQRYRFYSYGDCMLIL
jgi:S-adenosylmethionine:tRNA ribosyltransferase-isomerase